MKKKNIVRVPICQSVSSQSVSGHKNDHFERIRKACSFFLWCICFLLSVQIIEQNHTL